MDLTALDQSITNLQIRLQVCNDEISLERVASSITDEYKRTISIEKTTIEESITALQEVRSLLVTLDNTKAVLSHTHDAMYAAVAHAHDLSYAALNHNHDLVYEPKNLNIQQHVASAHAPSNAQKNSDITKSEIEAKLTGEITSHTHAGGGGGPTIKSGVVNLAAGGTSVVTFTTPFPVGVTPHIIVSSEFNGSDTSTTLFAHTVTNVGFTMKGAGNAAGNVAWIATSAGNT